MFIGSCFTESMGMKMLDNKFNCDINPFGILYNPVSIKHALEILISQHQFTETALVFYNEQWHSFYHHGRFSNPNIKECLTGINTRIEKSGEFLENADFLFITFGTSWIYRHLTTNQIVSNCHKIPAKEFERQKLSVEQIFVEYSVLIEKIIDLNPDINIIFTVSPVRHWKDGAHENQISKATLLLAIHELETKFPNVNYFPAYEILMDELRDYRYYEVDMLHPNKIAIDFVWEKFSDRFFSKNTLTQIDTVSKIIKAKQHRPQNTQSDSYRKFINQNIDQIKQIQNSLPYINLDDELNYFNNQIS